MNPKPRAIGYTGIEFVNPKTLILWNNVNRRIEVGGFDFYVCRTIPWSNSEILKFSILIYLDD
jgi:hypothetical protein